MTRAILKIFGVLILLSLITVIIIFWIKSPGKPTPFLHENGTVVENSISEIEIVNINGFEQKLIIRGENRDNPVLFYLHGGPGAPDYPFFREFNNELEKMFIVVYWEQRGAGMSFDRKLYKDEMKIADFLEDAIDISIYLKERFQKEKIFLMGHAWGSYIGMRICKLNPELYHAYFGVSQLINVLRGEIISYEWVSKTATKDKNEEAIADLWAIGYPPYDNPDAWYDYFRIERKWVQYYGGAFRTGTARDYFMAIINTPEYTMMDKINYFRGMKKTMQAIGRDYILEDLFWYVKYTDVPVYIIHGLYDYQVPVQLSETFHQILEAPVNNFYLFENSAHFPFIDEKERFNNLIRSILSEDFYYIR